MTSDIEAKAGEALSRADWQWLADQLRAWPERRVHTERTMFDGALRPMAADVIEAAITRIRDLEAALEPSADTKAAYIGEVKDRICERDEDGEEHWRDHTVSWDATKQIMQMIRSRARQPLSHGEDGDDL